MQGPSADGSPGIPHGRFDVHVDRHVSHRSPKSRLKASGSPPASPQFCSMQHCEHAAGASNVQPAAPSVRTSLGASAAVGESRRASSGPPPTPTSGPGPPSRPAEPPDPPDAPPLPPTPPAPSAAPPAPAPVPLPARPAEPLAAPPVEPPAMPLPADPAMSVPDESPHATRGRAKQAAVIQREAKMRLMASTWRFSAAIPNRMISSPSISFLHEIWAPHLP
jgi:hypothetical protein